MVLMKLRYFFWCYSQAGTVCICLKTLYELGKERISPSEGIITNNSKWSLLFHYLDGFNLFLNFPFLNLSSCGYIPQQLAGSESYYRMFFSQGLTVKK